MSDGGPGFALSQAGRRKAGALDRAALGLLLLIALATLALLPASPLEHLDDPSHLGYLGFVLTLLTVLAMRLAGFRGTRFERLVLSVFLAAMPLIYVASWLRSGSGAWLWVELLGLVVYGFLALLGLTVSPWFLALGIAAHGLFWDLWHYWLTSYVPDWYVLFCLLVDIGFGVYAAAQIRHWQEP